MTGPGFAGTDVGGMYGFVGTDVGWMYGCRVDRRGFAVHSGIGPTSVRAGGRTADGRAPDGRTGKCNLGVAEGEWMCNSGVAVG